MPYFVMIYGYGGPPIPLVDDEGVALFGSRSEAEGSADENELAIATGYEVYEWPPEQVTR